MLRVNAHQLAQRQLAASGRVAASLTFNGQLPRPVDWRLDPAHRRDVEALARALQDSMTRVEAAA